MRAAHPQLRVGGGPSDRTPRDIRDTDAVPFRVLFVCTGNVCRSPMAELLFRAWADPRADVVVGSAGTEALVGRGIDRSSASALGRLGVDPSRHCARQFEPWMAADADLVLTAGREHRDEVITAVPSAFRRTFTFREFARLAQRAPAAGEPAEVVAAVATGRGRGGPVAAEDDDVRDPYRGSIRLATEIAEQVGEAMRATLGALGLAAPEAAVGAAAASPAPRRRPLPYPRD